MRSSSLALVTAVACAFAQTPAVSHSPAGLRFGAGPISKTVIRGAPFSAEGQSQEIQTLADGTQVASPMLTWKFYRDSQGRTREERPLPDASMPGGALITATQIVIEIRDPVASAEYTLYPTAKRATRRHMDQLAVEPTTATATHGERVQPAEALGTQRMEGVLCDGTRTTTIWPEGSAGNESAVSVVSEVWKSADLQLIFLNKSDDPQTGERVHKLVHFSQQEPASDLFQVPPDYALPDDHVTLPRITHKVEPNYTDQARRAKYSGSVLLSVVVDTDGRARHIQVARPLGFGLDEEAIKAVNQWRFKPGMRNGRPAPVTVQIEVSFRYL